MKEQRDLLAAFLSAVLGVYLVLQFASSGAVAWKFAIVLGLATWLITVMQKTANVSGFGNRIKWYAFLFAPVFGTAISTVALGDLDTPARDFLTSTSFWMVGIIALCVFVSLEVNERLG